jgi:hypothetical protein
VLSLNFGGYQDYKEIEDLKTEIIEVNDRITMLPVYEDSLERLSRVQYFTFKE